MHHPLPDLDAIVGRSHDLADRPALERRADLKRGDVGLDVVHPAPHVRIDRHPLVADEQLAGPGVRNLDLDEVEVASLGLPDGSRRQMNFAGSGQPYSRTRVSATQAGFSPSLTSIVHLPLT